MKAKPKFDFVAQAPNQINLRRGLLYVVTHNGGNGGWSKAIDPTTGMLFNIFSSPIPKSYIIHNYNNNVQAKKDFSPLIM